jgi:hypothetical protein
VEAVSGAMEAFLEHWSSFWSHGVFSGAIKALSEAVGGGSFWSHGGFTGAIMNTLSRAEKAFSEAKRLFLEPGRLFPESRRLFMEPWRLFLDPWRLFLEPWISELHQSEKLYIRLRGLTFRGT